MPHVIVKLVSGRTEQQKKLLAEAIVKDVVKIAKCEEKLVSLAIEDFDKDDWAEKVYKPEITGNRNALYIEPGYNPFD